MNSKDRIRTSSSGVDPHIAQSLFELGGTFIILGMPVGTEFGIDTQAWRIGDQFKGIKMVPPGIHFVYFSASDREGQTAPRTGFFHVVKEREVLVKNYNRLEEDLLDETDAEQIERIKLNLKELDSGLGPYPFELWSRWISFTQYIDAQDITRLLPLNGRICSAPELITVEVDKRKQSHLLQNSNVASSDESIGSSVNVDQDEGLNKDNRIPTLPDMIPKPGTEMRFSKFPRSPYREGASPAEITKGSIDSSYTVQFLFDQFERAENVLGELQFAFVCFLFGQAWEGWEHWQRLMIALCNAEESLKKYPQVYLRFLSVLHYQIEEVPEELFADIVEGRNFLVLALRTLFANVNDNAATLPHELVSKAQKFRRHLTSKYRWSLLLEEEGDDAPLLVDADYS